jgi:excisionase family DNA binding protein
MSALVLDLPDELVDVLAERVAARLANRQSGEGGGWLRGAERIADYIDSPRSRVYALVSAGRIPVHRDGSALIARKAELDDWIQSGGGLRP